MSPKNIKSTRMSIIKNANGSSTMKTALYGTTVAVYAIIITTKPLQYLLN